MDTSKLNVGDFGDDVLRLHEKLKSHGFTVSNEEVKRRFYGPSTRDAVRECQSCHGLEVTGEVNEATAASLLTPAARIPAHPIAATPRLPAESSAPPLPLGGRKRIEPITPPLRQKDQGKNVVNLQECLSLLLGKQVIKASQEERRYLEEGLKREQVKQVYTDFTAKLVGRFQEQYSTQFHLAVTGEVDAATADALNRFLKELGAIGPGEDGAVFEVNGKVASRLRAGIGGLRVEIVDKNVGEDVHLAETVTDDGGTFQATFPITGLQERCKQRPDLQARAFTGEIFLGASEVRYNASNHETLNILLTVKASSVLVSEHETLIGALTVHCRASLRELQETDDRQDITYLANKTGWDARAVALAALADQFSAKTMDASGAPVIAPAFFYALFRAGLPANEDALYQTDVKSFATIWKQGMEQGVIPAALENSISQAVDHFQGLAAQRALDVPALVGISPLKEMLSVSLGQDAERQKQFAELYTRHRGDPPQFWNAVRGAFGEVTEKRLKLDGQLAYLTLNNAALMGKLYGAVGQNGLTDAVSLAGNGFYRTEKWQELIADGAIPPEIPGENDGEKRARYAELLSAQVRLSFPTAVVAQMVKNGEVPLTATTASVRDGVHAFLMEQQGKFEIGMHPVEQYLARNKLQIAPEVTNEVKRIQRVYQVTPSDTAMNALLKKGLDSAYAMVRYDQDEFVRTFKEELGGETDARLTYAKAQQVHNAVLNIATSYLIASAAPGIGVHSPAGILDPAPKGPNPEAANAGDVIAYPTLEGLFGEMDYCTCEHCRSILSPAAYLVDLLLFCDRPTNEKENPQTVLLERRPDIQHLPLTCENTNTPLPYIDLVNETLEYFVTNNLKLDNYMGHSTDGDARPEELLASPQFVSDAAHATLKAELFPPPLPFHQPLENLRRYFDKFEVPLPEIMEALRKDDSLERANANEYGWRDILMEELRLSRAEYALLTDRTLTLQQLYGYAPATSEADALAELSNAKAFTRWVDITYEEIIEILKTRFVNPNSTLIPKLERLGVPFATLKTLKESQLTGQAWLDLLPKPLPDASHYGGNIEAWVKNDANYARIIGLITLANPTATEDFCSFDKLELRYANPDNNANKLRTFEFVRLIRFIRLWRKLGWTIELTDKAIAALYPADQNPNDPDDAVNLQRLDSGFLTLLPRLGVVKRIMETLTLTSKKDLLPLLACFAPIDTHGAVSLYRQMFLSLALLKQAPAFADNGYGEFLTDNTQKLTAHAETLRAAFLLTYDEFALITVALGYDSNTLLTMDNISAVFRRGWLARKLRFSVREFLLLTKFTSVDPFAAPDPPNPPILRLIELTTRLRAVSLKPTQALYLIWNQDISGKSVPDDGEILSFARTLRSGLATIENEFALADDPDGSIARARMALVYGNEATDFFFGLLGGTLVTEVAYSHGQATLEQTILDTAPGRIVYDDFRKRLSYIGVMSQAARDALKGIAGVAAQFKAAVDSLYAENQKVIGPFFDRYPELLPLYNAYVASNDPVEKKRSDLLANFLPELKRRRKRQQALQTISSVAKTDIGFASAVLDDPSALHAAVDDARPALDDFTAGETVGLSAQFFFRDTATGNVDRMSEVEANLAYSAAGSNKLPANPGPGGAISGIWSGYLEAPENGFFNLRIEADGGATVTLALEGATVALVQNGNVWSNTAPIELRAGTLYAITLKVEKVKDTLSVRWESVGHGREIIPPRYLYSATLQEHLRAVYVRFLKAASLAASLRLTTAETVHFASHAEYRIGGEGWFNSLPVTAGPDNVTATALFTAFTALLDFARIKADLSPEDERLLTILKDPAAATRNSDSPLFTLTRWESDSLNALLARLGKVIADLSHLETFRRVYDAYATVKTMRIPASALIEAATNEPSAAIVRDLQAALRARYDESDWLNVLRPINDELRGLQRDALVAYILHQMRQIPGTAHIDTPDKLFEYFLMDVEMDPCMQTSRIRHALSSVQLFIERCLMNLEPRVAPSSIKVKQWEWMKRYRVWEANRKVFLWPENWLEPELRDDQSPFFKETMSELLQSDITEDRAATALLNYLSKLEEVAKLEPCGIHYVENDPGAADDIAHVVARTAGASRKYFYRRREYGYWTPWEQIKLDIEDNPVIPVVWKGRLFLFWLRILKQAPLTAQKPGTGDVALTSLKTSDIKTDATMVTVQAVLCWSEYYNGKWQPTKTSDVNRPTTLGRFDPNAFDRSKLRLSAFEAGGALGIGIDGEGGSSFFLYNTHSLPLRQEEAFGLHNILLFRPRRYLDISTDTFTVIYSGWLNPNDTLTGKHLTRSILKNPIGDTIVEPRHPLQNTWDVPFFYEDSRHVFYVTTSERIVQIPEWNWYGIIVDLLKPETSIPPLVLEPVEIIPDRYGPIVTGPHVGVVDPAPIERFVAKDAYVNKAIAATGTVRFGDKEFGPAGVLAKQQMGRL